MKAFCISTGLVSITASILCLSFASATLMQATVIGLGLAYIITVAKIQNIDTPVYAPAK